MTETPAPEATNPADEPFDVMAEPVAESEPQPTPAPAPAPAPAAETSELWGRSAPTENEKLLARTRVSETWMAIIVFALILVLLLIFVLQNTQRVEISYFTATFKIPLAVGMLLSAVAGVLLTAIAGTLRILQLRRRVKKIQRLSTTG